jgi:phage terminase large subunit-like protein
VSHRDDHLALLAENERRRAEKFRTYFPDTGPFRRDLYPRHLDFFAMGAVKKERLFMAANRIGKSGAGAYEVCCHATGLYPDWWQGKRFDGPVDVWACGTTGETTRDIVQTWLLGDPREVEHWHGSMIPAHLIEDFSRRSHGLANSLESVSVRHVSGGLSTIGFKTYEQGRKSFEGTSKHIIWDDEEPPEDVYTEQLLRITTTGGIVMVTFTPLQGMSEVVTAFLEPTEAASEFKGYVQAGWKHVPHLDTEATRALLATMPPHQVKARSEGEPTLGSGAIYPINEDDIIIPTRLVPAHFPRAYGMDVGWQRTAAVWGARDPGSQVWELYDEHYRAQGEPPSHAIAIQGRGDWMLGAIDPASMGSSQLDGRVAFDEYVKLGLHLTPAVNAVEAGITHSGRCSSPAG